MDDGIIHSSSSSMDNVHGRLHCSLWATSTDDLIIVQGGPRQLYTIFLSKEVLLVSLVMILDIVHSWSWTILMDELEMYQFFTILSGSILVIFRFRGYFDNFLGFRGFLVIFRFRGYFGHFLSFEGILVIF